MMMSNGFGAFFGGLLSGYVIDEFFTHDGIRDWHHIWLSFAGYALVIAVLFAILFKHKHNPNDVENIAH
jgi:NHS family xanthosine MFS transporter